MSESNKSVVFRINEIIKHPNADKLGIVKFHAYECIVRLGDYKEGDLAVYIPPDSIVPLDSPSFEFLKKMNKGARIKAQKLRGCISQGLVIPCPPNMKEGDDATEYYGIGHYNPPEVEEVTIYEDRKFIRFMNKWLFKNSKKAGKLAPKLTGPYYDIESWYRYPDLFKDTCSMCELMETRGYSSCDCSLEKQDIVITEKIHGMNARYTYQNGKFYICSRKIWRPNDGQNTYSKILKQNKWLQNLCKLLPNHIIYGEIYGKGVQKEIDYETDPNFRVFDIYDAETDIWLAWETIKEYVTKACYYRTWYQKLSDWLFGELREYTIPHWCIVPSDYIGPYDAEKIKYFISAQSQLTTDIREGIVIKHIVDTRQTGFGRKILKAVNPEYLER